ncbi:hypothetical protein K435DRAFT_789473 [Dendrothele bispora CBS 962.96]|uniref:Uncharacterized protein n=1 Tax=Dendrothele bispora (strain CBS 962.96) TaxID=1314807 RepID=A0A4S8MT14_DENBC|nr:hypothetical protein K435DRAFT_789473 [Dendrothele bispora CBS 962.96]
MADSNHGLNSITSTIDIPTSDCSLKSTLRLIRTFFRNGAYLKGSESLRQDALSILKQTEATLQRTLLEFGKYNEYVSEGDEEFTRLLTEHESYHKSGRWAQTIKDCRRLCQECTSKENFANLKSGARNRAQKSLGIGSQLLLMVSLPFNKESGVFHSSGVRLRLTIQNTIGVRWRETGGTVPYDQDLRYDRSLATSRTEFVRHSRRVLESRYAVHTPDSGGFQRF